MLDDLAHSQILAAEAGELALKLYHEASDSAEIGGKLLGLAALSEKSVSLNAKAHEMLQELIQNA
ncbi:hypothetical protein [Herminiimonas sp. CN]|uniref:hypothetical protein n=1 Tax=Herminiimonas sp. CN TaxID=1349818 RepID=UPI000473ADE3|nr:hypothetical protein [Herminiimonas sp. CN]